MFGPILTMLGLLFFAKKAGAASMPSLTYGPPKAAYIEAQAQDIDILARTLFGEARSEGRAGMQAVANVVINRLKRPSRFRSTIRDICLQPKQFSAWNRNDPNRPLMLAATLSDPRFRLAYEIAQLAVTGKLPDITHGADHYYATYISAPSWARGKTPVKVIGAHKFYNNIA